MFSIEPKSKMLLLRISSTLVSTLLDRRNVTSYSQNFITIFHQIGVTVFQALDTIDGCTRDL